ncbi:AAA family ATPase [Pelagibacteraceae bacterium]|nr:AAA family ATPase [Pelagibacteraceae bacterium]
MFDLIGFNEQIENLIKNYEDKKLQSSIIFYGPKGIGKRHFVNKLILELIKLNFIETNVTHHFNLFLNNTHPNIKLIEKDFDKKTKKISNNITIDQIRNLNKFNSSSPSIQNLEKFIIIDSADDLNLNSANSILKTLEEPKNNTFIFLISHQISSLLPTLRSRCQKIKLQSHTYQHFKLILSSLIDDLNDDEINFFYDLTQGSPGIAISLYNDDIFYYLNQTIESLNTNGLSKDVLSLSNSLSKMDDVKFKNYLSALKYLLIIIHKSKININFKGSFLSQNLKNIQNISSELSIQNIIDRFDFLIKNEKDLFTYNLDKKIFIQKLMIS